jgi:hypothetical protein
MDRIIVVLREEIRMDETREKSVVEGESKEKIGDAIDRLDLLHRLFIDHGDYEGHPGHWVKGMTSSWYGGGWKTHHRASRQTTCRRSDHNTYPPLSLRIAEVG